MTLREPLTVVRRMMLALLVLELIGTGAELLLMSHYEDVWQIVPLALIALALGILGWHRASRSASTIRALRVTMVRRRSSSWRKASRSTRTASRSVGAFDIGPSS